MGSQPPEAKIERCFELWQQRSRVASGTTARAATAAPIRHPRPSGWIVLLALLLVAPVAAVGASARTARSGSLPSLTTAGTVTLLAADGSRVAAATTGVRGRCDSVVVWDTRAAATYRAATNCPGSGGSLPEAVYALALAGTTVAWAERMGGNREDLSLEVASPAWKAPRLAAYEENGNGASGLVEGDYLGHLRGAGTLIAFDTWHVCTLEPPGAKDPYGIDEPCTGSHPAVSERSHAVDRQAVWRLAGARKARVASGAGAFPVLAVDATRIAVHTPSGAVALRSPAGAVLATVPVPPGTLTGAALAGRRLAVVRAGLLEVYDTANGSRTVSLPLPRGALLSGLTGATAAYVSGRTVTLVRLGDGRKTEIRVGGTGAVSAALTGAGLFYAHDHEIVFRRPS